MTQHKIYEDVFRDMIKIDVSEFVEAKIGFTAGMIHIRSESYRAGLKAMMEHKYYNGGFSQKLKLAREIDAEAFGKHDVTHRKTLGVDYDMALIFDKEEEEEK